MHACTKHADRTSVGIGEEPAVGDAGEVLEVGDHVARAERAVEADGEGLGVRDLHGTAQVATLRIMSLAPARS